MKYNQLGDSELHVSEIGLGTMTFGQQNTASEAAAQLDRALDAGINFIDTAEMYPVPPRQETQGRTESIVGDWLSGKTRDSIIVATKIAASGRPIHWIRKGALAINRQNVRSAVEASLKRLKTDYIDLYQIHWPDRYVPMFGEIAYNPEHERTSTPVREQLAALAEVVQEGKVRYIGLSNETPWGVSEFCRVAKEYHLPRVVSIQNAYSLLNRTFDGPLAETSRRENVPLLAYSPLAFGLLSGKHLGGPAPQTRFSLFDNFAQRYRKLNVESATREYVELANDLGTSPAKLAIAFVRSQWFAASTIIGATTQSQLEENISSLDLGLDASVLARINAIHTKYPNPAP